MRGGDGDAYDVKHAGYAVSFRHELLVELR